MGFMKSKLIILLFIFPACFLLSQITPETDPQVSELSETDSIAEGDLTAFDTMQLNNAELFHLNLRTDLEKKYYLWLRKRVRDVWPYVKVAVEEYNLIEDTAKTFN